MHLQRHLRRQWSGRCKAVAHIYRSWSGVHSADDHVPTSTTTAGIRCYFEPQRTQYLRFHLERKRPATPGGGAWIPGGLSPYVKIHMARGSRSDYLRPVRTHHDGATKWQSIPITSGLDKWGSNLYTPAGQL